MLQVKVVHVYVDGELLSPESGYLVRRAPGHVHYDFGQTIPFRGVDRPLTSETNEALPRGCIILCIIYMYIAMVLPTKIINIFETTLKRTALRII